MKKLIFITLLISILTVLGVAQDAKKAEVRPNSEATVTPTGEKQKAWMVNNFTAVSEVRVTLLTPEGEKVQSVATDNKGAFNFTNVAAGKYVVVIGNYDVKSFKALSHVIISPRDPASGLSTGKRMHKPFVITKELDKSSPLLATSSAHGAVAIPTPTACGSDCEGLVEITLGSEEVTSAAVSSVSTLAGGGGAAAASYAKISNALNIQQGIEIKETGSIDGNILMRQQINKSKSNVKNNKQTQGATFGEKTKHDTVKNSVGNIR